jgi:hypothetical protein
MQNNGLDPWKSDIIQSFASPTYFWSFNVKKPVCLKLTYLHALHKNVIDLHLGNDLKIK